MSSRKTYNEFELVAQLQEVRDNGGQLLNALYVHHSVQRAMHQLTTGNGSTDTGFAMLSFAEQELIPLLGIEQTRHTLVQTFRKALEYLTRIDGLASATDLSSSLVQTLGLVHLLDGVKDNKISIQKDFALYEEYLEKEQKRQEDLQTVKTTEDSFEDRIDRCRRLKEVFSSGWWFLNGLLTSLGTLSKAAKVLVDLLEFITRELIGEEESSSSTSLLPHERYKLLRALPIALYLHYFLNKKQTFKEPINPKLMDACFKLLRRYPVVPGVGDYVVLLYAPILGIIFTTTGVTGKDPKRYSTMSLDELDKKYLEYLDREYCLEKRHRQVREVHDHLCDMLTCFLKTTEKWTRAGGKRPIDRCEVAVNLSFNILHCLSSWRCSIHELLAWRKSAPTVAETQQDGEQSNGHSSLLKRVSRLFQDSEVPLVLEILVCVDGLATLFAKYKEYVLPYAVDWLQHSAKIFLEQASKKRGLSEPDTRTIFSTIASLKEQVIETRQGGSHSISRSQAISNTRFDAADSEAAKKLRKAVEELHLLYCTHPPKPKISSFICGHLTASSSVAQKATKDLLQQLYKILVVLDADEHLDKVMDFSDLCLREREIEVTGKVQLNSTTAVAYQLADAAINSSYGGSLEPVLTALGLFESTSEKLLTFYKARMTFFELRKTAMEGLDVTLKNICKQALIQGKLYACCDVLFLPPVQWIEGVKGKPRRSARCFDPFFKIDNLCLAGCDIEIKSSLVTLVDKTVNEELSQIVAKLESSKDPTILSETRTRVKILRCAYQWLSKQLPLEQDDTLTLAGRSSDLISPRLSKAMQGCIVETLFQDFVYDMRFSRFKMLPQSSMEPFSFKICPRPSTPKISLNEFRKDSANVANTFGVSDIEVLYDTLTAPELDQLIARTRDYILQQLSLFLSTNMQAIFDLFPLELIDFRVANLVENEGLTPVECLSFLLDKFGSTLTDISAWFEPLRNLERLGNAIAFLYLLQVHVTKKQAICTISQTTRTTSRRRGMEQLSTVRVQEEEDSEDDIDTGNPFEQKIRKQRSRTRVDSARAHRKEFLIDCLEQVSVVMTKWLDEGKRSLHINNAFSAILFLKTYTQANSHVMNILVGDGILWAARLIMQCSNQISHFEHTDWTHELISLVIIQEANCPIQVSNDVRCMLISAMRVTNCWKRLSRYRFLSPKAKRPFEDSENTEPEDKSLRMRPDPPLRGFFGGMCYVSFNERRSTHPTLARKTAPVSPAGVDYTASYSTHVRWSCTYVGSETQAGGSFGWRSFNPSNPESFLGSTSSSRSTFNDHDSYLRHRHSK